MTHSKHMTRAEQSSSGELCHLHASAFEMGLSNFAVPVTPADPLGTLRKLPAEIRAKIWRVFIQNPLKDRPSSMALLRTSKAVYNEALLELYRDMELLFTLDPERLLSVSVTERGGNLPIFDVKSVTMDREHCIWKIPIQKVKKITFEILPPSAKDTAQGLNLCLLTDRLLKCLSTIWPELPILDITFKETKDRKWWSDGYHICGYWYPGVWNASYHGWPSCLVMCAQFFLSLRNCEEVEVNFEGYDVKERDELPDSFATIAETIRERAILKQAYGTNRLIDDDNDASAMVISRASGWVSWDHAAMFQAANDYITEQLLNLARGRLEMSVDVVPGRMGARLRLACFANWSKEYEVQNFNRLIGRNDDSSFGQINDNHYGRKFLRNFQRRYSIMREFNPLAYANVAFYSERRLRSKSFTKLERRALREDRDFFAPSVWTSKYSTGFPSFESLASLPRPPACWWSSKYVRPHELRADGVHVAEKDRGLMYPLSYSVDPRDEESSTLSEVAAAKSKGVAKPARRSIEKVVAAKGLESEEQRRETAAVKEAEVFMPVRYEPTKSIREYEEAFPMRSILTLTATATTATQASTARVGLDWTSLNFSST